MIEGDTICKDVLQLHPSKIHFVCATANWIEANTHLLHQHELYQITDQELKRISSQKTPNQVLMVLNKKSESLPVDSFNNTLCFYLDKIQDPGNMGTILRIADWFGLVPLYVSPGCVDIYNPKVVQSSMGSVLSVPVVFETLDELKRFKSREAQFYATLLVGKPLPEVKWTRGGLIIIGNESTGISTDIQQICDQHITIPKSPKSNLDSLNAAIAAGIIASWAGR